MIKHLLIAGCCALFCFVTIHSVHADQSLTDQGAEFNFDTDNSGDAKLKRSGMTDVLELATFYIYVSSEGQLRQLSGASDDGSNVAFGQESDIDSFDPISQQGVASGFINSTLVFTSFSQAAGGVAQLDYRLDISGGGIHSNGSPTTVSVFAVFDFEGSGFEQSFATPDGIVIADVNSDTSEGRMLLSAGPGDGLIGIFDTDTAAFDQNSFAGPLETLGTNLVGGHWLTFDVPLDIAGNPQDFSFSLSGSISAVPEPTSALAIGLVGLGFLMRRRR